MSFSKQSKNYKFIVLGIISAITIIILLSSNLNEYFSEPIDSERFEIVEPNFENSENLKLLPEENLNEITSNRLFLGFPVHSYMNFIEAENSQEKYSIRFTSKFSGDISSILLPLHIQGDSEVKAGLQESVEGYPSGVWLDSGMVFTHPLKIPSTEVFAVNFTQNIPIESGKIYHIVIEPTIKKNDQTVMLKAYDQNWTFNSLNHTNPDESWIDPAMNTLFFNGESWAITHWWPSYVINYSNGISDGQPYTLFAPWIIGDNRYVGQAVIPYSNYKVNEIAFVVGKKGNPTDDLHYAIYDSEDMLIENGIFAKKEEITSSQNWRNKSLSSTITFESGKLYRVVLYSPNSTLEDGYFVYGHEFMLDKTLGYGSTIHHLTASFDGLKSWIEWYDADAVFKLINSK